MHEMMNYWCRRPIPGYPEYAADNWGDIWTLWRMARLSTGRVVWSLGTEWTKMRKQLTRSGHYRLGLRRPDGTKKNKLVHCLVLEAFIGPCPPGLECRHKNGLPGDNFVGNIVWGTRSENANDRGRHGVRSFRGEGHVCAVMTEEEVLLARKLSADGMLLKDIVSKLGHNMGTVQSAIVGKSWSHLPNAKRYGGQSRKITEDVANTIKSRLQSGEPPKSIARSLGISNAIVYQIKSGRTWN